MGASKHSSTMNTCAKQFGFLSWPYLLKTLHKKLSWIIYCSYRLSNCFLYLMFWEGKTLFNISNLESDIRGALPCFYTYTVFLHFVQFFSSNRTSNFGVCIPILPHPCVRLCQLSCHFESLQQSIPILQYDVYLNSPYTIWKHFTFLIPSFY